MSDDTQSTSREVVVTPVPAQAAPAQQKASLLSKVTKELIAILVWSYIILKLFVRDVDRDLLRYVAPDYVWLLNFKLIAILCVITFTLIAVRKWGGWWKIAYIAAYPIIVLCWKIPYWVFRQRSWPLAIAFINAVTSFFGSLKYTA